MQLSRNAWTTKIARTNCMLTRTLCTCKPCTWKHLHMQALHVCTCNQYVCTYKMHVFVKGLPVAHANKCSGSRWPESQHFLLGALLVERVETFGRQNYWRWFFPGACCCMNKLLFCTCNCCTCKQNLHMQKFPCVCTYTYIYVTRTNFKSPPEQQL